MAERSKQIDRFIDFVISKIEQEEMTPQEAVFRGMKAGLLPGDVSQEDAAELVIQEMKRRKPAGDFEKFRERLTREREKEKQWKPEVPKNGAERLRRSGQ